MERERKTRYQVIMPPGGEWRKMQARKPRPPSPEAQKILEAIRRIGFKNYLRQRNRDVPPFPF